MKIQKGSSKHDRPSLQQQVSLRKPLKRKNTFNKKLDWKFGAARGDDIESDKKRFDDGSKVQKILSEGPEVCR